MLVVGKESFCDYHKIQEAIDSLEREPSGQADTLYILSGIYNETVRIYRSYLTVIGIGLVEITMNRYAKERDEAGEEINTFATPTLFLGGTDLVLENLVISNSAGQGEHIGQAVAVYAHCDQTVFRHCTFKGHQDTLFTGPLPPTPRERGAFGGVPLREHHAQYRQLYQHCYIEGTIDFIFGGATAYFDQCEIRSLRHSENQAGYITAASTPERQSHGFIFKNCFLTADPDITSVFLGRPWREYAKTVFVGCQMGSHIHPLGWDNWNNSANEQTVRYQEYDVKDAALLSKKRVPWADCFEDGGEALDKKFVFAGSDFWK
ncbi:pectinesterase family protein [Paenibacillus sp. B2(2019)]|uniref:pectinesterase family protein n=1 Tax=Paenibacillus sp. B2(2019) TaxID=2607754 RepID=UPI0011F14ADF|nr:pectinesterase family protein [Paenibacillus sp. B2(2019)]KAA1189916.1 pectin methylesterase [Paenibacillus sp. B2(2019)]